MPRVLIPIRTRSELNLREHWAVRAKRVKQQKQDATIFVLAAAAYFDPSRTIVLTRLGKRKLDSDNLAGALKHVQDAVAKHVGIDDADLKWEYRQVVSKEWGVIVEQEEDAR